MFSGFVTTQIETSGGARIHLRHGGKGPPLLLLHGNPQSHVIWHLIAERLAEHFHVVATDLRGYGDSSAPDTANLANYTFRAMAQDQVEVMQALGYEQFMVAGHDRGARTAHRMALDHPERVTRLALLDILPTRHIWRNVNASWAMKSWHWVFMAQEGDLPEQMMMGVPARFYMERKIGKPGMGMSIFAPEAVEEYIRCFTEKTIRASCADYRATATLDRVIDDADADRKIACPTLVLNGGRSHTAAVFDNVLAVWRDYAEDVVGAALDSGHYVPEHAPEAVLDWFLRFFTGVPARPPIAQTTGA
ncbi:haloacetate dehalogenase [Humitalea rosea]|uniref:Haloacetate dehalogenase n=1 Tax=Humitalea rosea TaxID=990373 RepID=A0A2W7IXQ4_9PROT|nr:alpha/beta hydrolase [Humitalea rosea]PZW50975.1 haloacetate dehalogenase [Humitalea rosea]